MTGYDHDLFCERVRDKLCEQDITVSRLVMRTKLNETTVYGILTTPGRKQGPRAETLIRIADALDVSVDWLLGRDKEDKS